MLLSTIPAPIPPEEQRCDAINTATVQHARALYSAIGALNLAYEFFWSGSAEEVVAFFNKLGGEQVLAACTAHHAQATALNNAIDAAVAGKAIANELTNRAFAVARFPIQWNAEPLEGAVILFTDGAFSLAA
jgi:hypothetical protein